MKSPTGQLTLSGLDVFSKLEQAEGQAPAPATHLFDRGSVELFGLPALVSGAQGLGQPHNLAPVEGRHLAADGENAVGSGLGQIELTAASQGAHERGMPAAS
jgi:hypothetical protein